MDSPRVSVVHPVLGFAEKRGFCIKREVIELMSIQSPALQSTVKRDGIDSTNWMFEPESKRNHRAHH